MSDDQQDQDSARPRRRHTDTDENQFDGLVRNAPERLDVNLNLNVAIRDESATGASALRLLSQILARLGPIEILEKKMAADIVSVKQLVTDINDETNVLGTKVDAQTQQIADLKAQVAAGSPVTQADLDALADGLTPISARLKALGADPAQPIPAEPSV